MDPIMPTLVGAVAAILLIGMVLRALRQPQVIAYLAAGVVLGPSGLALMTDQVAIARLGEIGVVLLLFFIGMEISLPKLLSSWKVPVIGTLLQISLSVGLVLGFGAVFDWGVPRSLLLGFVVSLSSTAVVVKLLQAKDELDTPLGRDILGVLLVQDLAIVPMMIAIALMGGESAPPWRIASQVVGGLCVVALLIRLAKPKPVRLPLGAWLGRDKELQVFGAGALCFGFALLTGLAGLSTALGAFVAGVLVGAARETDWIHEALFPLHVVLLALFFVSIGMLIDLEFLSRHVGMVAPLVGVVVAVNTALNFAIFRVMGLDWRDSLYGGAALSQVGELSFVLAAVGKQTGMIGDFGYRTTILVIALSLFVSPPWIAVFDRVRARRRS